MFAPSLIVHGKGPISLHLKPLSLLLTLLFHATLVLQGENYLHKCCCCNLSGSVALIMWFTTNGMWVKNKTIIYVARASNNKRDCEHDLYCCLLPQCETLCTCRSGFPIATLSSGDLLGSIDRWPLEESIRFCFAGEHHCLVQQMNCERPDHFKTYFRMTPEQFSKLLHIVRPFITKQTTKLRKPICADEWLAVTLRWDT